MVQERIEQVGPTLWILRICFFFMAKVMIFVSAICKNIKIRAGFYLRHWQLMIVGYHDITQFFGGCQEF